MSTRERWIVYPLIFLTLGIAMRDKVVPPPQIRVPEIAANRIHCNQLQVDLLQVNQAAVCKRLESKDGIVTSTIVCFDGMIIGPKGRPMVIAGVDSKTKNGVIQLLSSSAMSLVRLQASDEGENVLTREVKKKKSDEAPAKPPQKTPPDSPKPK
jgi:hypothetical protein